MLLEGGPTRTRRVANRRPNQSGQVMVLVAVAMLALIGSAALVLVAGSVEWQKNQLQELADSAALDAATITVGVGCDAVLAPNVIKEADRFLRGRRSAVGAFAIAAGTCATPYTLTDNFAGGLTARINYPYRAHQQQVEVILTLALPIAFGAEVGVTTTNVVRRAVAQGLAGSVPAVTATNLTCTSGQVNIGGSVMTQNRVVRNAGCVLFAHARVAAGTYSDLGNIGVYTDGQAPWKTAAGRCTAPISNAICADGYELSGHNAPACAPAGTAFLLAGDAAINPNPCAIGTGPQPVPPVALAPPPEPNLDRAAVLTLRPARAIGCDLPVAAVVYPNIQVGPPLVTIGTGVAGSPAQTPVRDVRGYYHFQPGCYGYLDISRLPTGLAVLDPGYYYFNGLGFAGGGGICLNGKTLLARDVTIEFANRAGFSSGTCAPGGGANCAAPCTFGTLPCSLGACVPNPGADALNLTWFAAPCSPAVPAPDAASCVASWCPPGDRACSNLLIWAKPALAPPAQISLKGPAVRAWLLGTIYWPGTCTDVVNATSRIAGTISCGTLSIQAAAGAGNAVGGDYGINTAVAEAVLIE